MSLDCPLKEQSKVWSQSMQPLPEGWPWRITTGFSKAG